MKPFSKTLVSKSNGCFQAAGRNRVLNVTGYRLYGLDGVSKVSSGEWFEAEDDETAIEVAKTKMDGHDCELWEGKRLVKRIPSQHKSGQ